MSQHNGKKVNSDLFHTGEERLSPGGKYSLISHHSYCEGLQIQKPLIVLTGIGLRWRELKACGSVLETWSMYLHYASSNIRGMDALKS